MNDQAPAKIDPAAQINAALETTRKVITQPVEFFRAMPKQGGLIDPLIYMVLVGVVVGVLSAVLSIFHLGMARSIGTGLVYIIAAPIAFGVFGFVSAAILFVIWKIMGSQEPYETAYRCAAYSAAIVPITTLAGLVPYVGALAGLAWMLYLVVIASTEVHKLPAKISWIVFGVLFGLMALASINGEVQGRRMKQRMKDWEANSPEDAGRRLGEMMRGMEQGAKGE